MSGFVVKEEEGAGGAAAAAAPAAAAARVSSRAKTPLDALLSDPKWERVADRALIELLLADNDGNCV